MKIQVFQHEIIFFSDRLRYPPDEWIILPEDRFAIHVIENAEQSLTADVLLQVGRSARQEGCFKIQLGGSEILHADFLAKNVLVMGGATSFKRVVRPGREVRKFSPLPLLPIPLS